MIVEVDDLCPECSELVEDIELNVMSSRMREEVWGAPAEWGETEVEVVHIPECPECHRVTVDDEAASEAWRDSV